MESKMSSRERNSARLGLETEIRNHVQPVARIRNQATTCVVHSNHPLAFRTIKEAISRDPDLRDGIRPYSNSSGRPAAKNGEILVIDTCSVESWEELLEKWQGEGGRAIALVPADVQNEAGELQMLYLGATGIVPLSDELIQKLPEVVHAVVQGKLWIRRGILNEYVRRTNLLLRRLSTSDPMFTAREHQIIDFLRRGYSNKQIANMLDISERTVKFHVSNVLRKCNMEDRRGFLTVAVNNSFHRGPLNLAVDSRPAFALARAMPMTGNKEATLA